MLAFVTTDWTNQHRLRTRELHSHAQHLQEHIAVINRPVKQDLTVQQPIVPTVSSVCDTN